MTTAEEMIERSARAVHASLKIDSPKIASWEDASELAREQTRKLIRVACAVAVEMCAEMITPPDTEGGEYFDGLRGQAARFKALATAIKGE